MNITITEHKILNEDATLRVCMTMNTKEAKCQNKTQWPMELYTECGPMEFSNRLRLQYRRTSMFSLEQS